MLLRETRLSSNWRGITLQFDLATLSTQRLSETSDATYETYVNSSSFEFAVAIKARLLLGSWWETIEASQPQVIKSVYVVHPPLRRSLQSLGHLSVRQDALLLVSTTICVEWSSMWGTRRRVTGSVNDRKYSNEHWHTVFPRHRATTSKVQEHSPLIWLRKFRIKSLEYLSLWEVLG